MRGRSTKLETSEQGMEIDDHHKLSKLKEEPQLSGAYIRSLVKQLSSSSRTKDPVNPKIQSCVDGVDAFSSQNMTKFCEGLGENLDATQQRQQQQEPQPPQQHKKQVRRRLHTSRPYQERLLNMAEARREIVTALKFHRAQMRQANEQKQQHQQEQQQQQQQQEQQQQQQQQHQSPPLPVQLSAGTSSCFEQQGKTKARRHARMNPSITAGFPNYFDNVSYASFSPPPPTLPPPMYPLPWPTTPILPPTVADSLNFPLPNQTLGLNLNFHDFSNIDTILYHNGNKPPSVYSPSSSTSSLSPPLSIVTEETPPPPSKSRDEGLLPPAAVSDMTESYAGGGLHQVMDDEEMAEIRSIGEQHQMEWNDRMNLVTSAWWFKFSKTMELDPEVKAEDDGYQPFDQVMEFPSWLNTNEGGLQQYFNDYCSPEYFQDDPALPCMDIGEIDGVDGEWLA